LVGKKGLPRDFDEKFWDLFRDWAQAGGETAGQNRDG